MSYLHKFWFPLIRWIVPVVFIIIILHQGGVIDINAILGTAKAN